MSYSATRSSVAGFYAEECTAYTFGMAGGEVPMGWPLLASHIRSRLVDAA